MKKYILLIAAVICSLTKLSAQVTLPYATGFDNDEEKEGWGIFSLSPEDDAFSEWRYITTSPYSAPECISHNYPVGGTLVTDHWFVSPGFLVPAGGMVDSIWASFSGFGVPGPGDTVALYLLTGSPNPEVAHTRILLFDFRDSNYVNDHTWRKFSVEIPPSPAHLVDNSYLAIQYRTTANWLDVKFDNIGISAFPTSAGNLKNNRTFSIYPNPSHSGTVNIKTSEQFRLLRIFDISGKLVLSDAFREQIDISRLAKGSYIIELTTSSGIKHNDIFIKQ